MSENRKKSGDSSWVLNVAQLARINLSQEEEVRFSEQLGAVLTNFELLQKVDIKNVEATAQVTGLKNVFRDDLITNPKGRASRDKLLKNAAEVIDGSIKVPGVFKNE